jgi:phosphohistidine phosphatase SixA
MKSVHWLVPALAALLPFGASAQTNDADYCKALTQKYETYVSNMSVGHSPGSGTIDASVAISQCRDGNTASGIPVLEKRLRDARIDLPPRG